MAAHPRVGGENDWTEPNIELMPGSSPRGRGKRGGRHRNVCRRRLIPAWAGKTYAHRDSPTWHRAHPRVGGENQLSETCIIVGVGSSPRGRGKPLVQARRIREEGLIPAWAGKT